MRLNRKLVVAVGAAVALAAGGTGAALAVGGGGGDDGDGKPVPALAATKAKAAALQVTGGGTVTALELDGEHGATYEVEVTKPDGRSVDVRLDDAFALVGQPEPNGDASERGDDADVAQGDHGTQDDHADGETNDD